MRAIAPGARVVSTFTGSGTYTKSSGARYVAVLVIGGGGGGGFGGTYLAASSGSGGGGGGGGGTSFATFRASDLTATVAVTMFDSCTTAPV